MHGEANDHTTYDVFNQFKAIYPFIGGTAFAHSLNICDTTLFGITFLGSPTHNANGVTFDGSTQIGSTYINPKDYLGVYNKCAIAYIDNIGSASLPWLFASWDSSSRIFGIRRNTSGSLNAVGVNDNQSVASNTWATKCMAIDINPSVQAKVYDSGTVKTTLTPYNENPDKDIKIGGLEAGVAYTDCRFKFFAVGNSLSDAQHQSIAISINNYQTALSRA